MVAFKRLLKWTFALCLLTVIQEKTANIFAGKSPHFMLGRIIWFLTLKRVPLPKLRAATLRTFTGVSRGGSEGTKALRYF